MKSLLFLTMAAILLAGCEPKVPLAETPPEKTAQYRSPLAEDRTDRTEGTDRTLPLVALPPAPWISPEGYQLILDWEVGGGERYYSRFLARPTWPGAASGVTVGVGYDCGYNSQAVIASDWSGLRRDWVRRLCDTSGAKRQAAKALIPGLRDILVEWGIAEGVFCDVTLTRFYQLACRTFPGLEDLDPRAQGVLTSLVFNRGNSLEGPRRREMREMVPLVARRDYRGMARKIREMKRLWIGAGVDGLLKRRDAEARLMEDCASIGGKVGRFEGGKVRCFAPIFYANREYRDATALAAGEGNQAEGGGASEVNA